MNTPRSRFLLGILVSGLSAARIPAAAGDPPDALRWVRYAEPSFPAQLQATRVHDGFATVVFTFDDTGRVTDRLVIAASHPAFTGAVLEATQLWQVDTRELAPYLRRETLRYNFRRTGSVITLSNRDAARAEFSPYGDEAARAVGTCREDALDRPLQATAVVTPEYPSDLKARGTRGHATVSFIVDAAGRVRVPALAAAAEAEFGVAALAAIRRWTFVPGRQQGKPVQVNAERTFVFGAAGQNAK